MLAQTKPCFKQLLLVLQHLDRRLETAVAAVEAAYGTEANNGLYRGLQIDAAEVGQLIEQAPGNSVLYSEQLQNLPSDAVEAGSPLAWLQDCFGLSSFDLNIIAVALAPELDRRYERLYAYLQDDVRAKRPTVDLSLNLLCASSLEKLMRRTHFAAESPLIRHGLLHLIPDPNQAEPSLLAHIIKLDPQVVRLLLEEQGLDRRLVSVCQLISPQIQFQELPISVSIQQALLTLIQADWQTNRSLKLYFHGIDRAGKRQVAEAMASVLKIPLLTVKLAKILAAKSEFIKTLNLIFQEALFQNALLYIEELEALQTPDHELFYHTLIESLATYSGRTILSGLKPWLYTAAQLIPQGIFSVPFAMPNFEQRRFYWMHYLKAANIFLSSSELDTLSDRFRLTSDQIANAAIAATHQVKWKNAAPTLHSSELAAVQINDIFLAVRGTSGRDLEALSRQINPHYRWDDIVLPAPLKAQLREICEHVKHQYLVWERWGFNRQQSLGKGLNVMFAGTPGTGKTMAAEVIAQELQLDLYKIDLSQIVSKYIGETEKNLNQIFTAATNANAILLFDEADALFGKRSDVKDAHDRYANLEISYLLQKMEEYEGLAILTTNLRANMDDAFMRRLRFIVEFPIPGEKQRQQIWQKVFPDLAPRSPELDLGYLARNFELTGANIRSIALASAFLAATEGNPIAMSHLTQAVRREYQKMGKIMKEI
ncbi:MAG: ATP-binding protein [Nostoc sp.]|uniref:AAA family ATPase n=1 Tax=Nostoc sp. TaxID=1180 RepID=UPI002FF7E93D